MDFTNDIRKIKELLDGSPDVLIVTHEHPTHDSIGSALALSLGLTSMGKTVTVVCPDVMTVELSGYIGAQKVQNSIGRKNFVISLDYVDGSIEKVSYNIEGDKFNLVIEPRSGFEAFSEEKVHYSHSGSAAGVIMTVDTIHLGGLKKLFDENTELFESKPIVNIDRHPNNAQYGHTNMVNDQASSTAEIVAELLTGLGVTVSEDIATNILNAVIGATGNFQNPNVRAETFELAARMMKSGGKRFRLPLPQETIPVVPHGQPVVPQAPPVSTAAQQPAVQTQVHQQPPQQPHQVTAAHPASPVQPPKPQRAPPDWLKPKIFKSSNIS